MDPWLLLKSASVGLAVAAPVGPMSLMCMQRVLARGQAAGLAFGAGVAAADASYAAVAAFGVSAISSFLVALTPWIKLGGALLLVWMGTRIARSVPGGTEGGNVEGGNARAFATAYGLTLTNPPTILFFAGVFASVGSLGSHASSLQFTLGVFAGSLAWWLVLTSVVRAAAARLTPPVMQWLNRVSGGVLVAYGAYGLLLLAGDKG